MDHDEVATKSTRIKSNEDVNFPAFPLEFGGGLSLCLAASLNPSIASIFLGIGGLLPLVATSVAIALHRGGEFLSGSFAPLTRIIGRANLPMPHLARINADSRTGTDLRQAPSQSIRGRFEDARPSRSK